VAVAGQHVTDLDAVGEGLQVHGSSDGCGM
jgi:hypothetical protein